MRILIVEDEIELQSTIAEGLRLDGYAVDACDNGAEACELCFVETYKYLEKKLLRRTDPERMVFIRWMWKPERRLRSLQPMRG